MTVTSELRGVELMEAVHGFLRRNRWVHDQTSPGHVTDRTWYGRRDLTVMIPGIEEPVLGRRGCIGAWANVIAGQGIHGPIGPAADLMGLSREEERYLFDGGPPGFLARWRLGRVIRRRRRDGGPCYVVLRPAT